MKAKTSLETRLIALYLISLILPFVLCTYIVFANQLDVLEVITLLLVFLLPISLLFFKSFRSVTDTLDRIGLQLDALGNEEYNSWHLAGYEGGRVEHLKKDFMRLGEKLAHKRVDYMYNESFLADFIKVLDLPILVLDHHHNIYSSNACFDRLFQQSGPQIIGKASESVGIGYLDGRWQQQTTNTGARFEISEHVFRRAGNNFHLLVLFSIEQQLRANEKQVWQRLVRVINHEVSNSLTPIYSMSQSLQEMQLNEQASQAHQVSQQKILKVIEQRAQHLLAFVDSYSAFSKLSAPKLCLTDINEINERLRTIFPKLSIRSVDNVSFMVDLGQLEQALINIIKNAFEASAENEDCVEVHWTVIANELQINILDKGHGIANTDNLFVPFYSTKSNGTGIGLVLSRELVRNQGGELTLVNRNDITGASACIKLPIKRQK